MDSTAASQEMFRKFWTDWFAMVGNLQTQAASSMAGAGDGAGAAGAAQMPPFSPEAARQMQSAFLEQMSRYCDEYMRSPQFLTAMKQAMDNALAFRQQVNEFLNRTTTAGFQQTAGFPPDQAVIVDAIRETERKLSDRLDELGERLSRVERRADDGAVTGA